MRRCARLSIALALLLACAGGSGASATTGDDATASSTSQSSSATDGLSSTSVATTISTTSTTATTATSTSTTTPTTASTTEGESTGPACSMDHGENSWQCEEFTLAGCCPGEKCNPWPKDGSFCANRCVPVASDPDGIGEPCTVVDDIYSGIDTCVAGAVCWAVDLRTNIGVCVELCHGDIETCVTEPASCCAEHHACAVASCGAFYLCLETCHPLLQDCGRPGSVCYPLSEGFQCAPDVSGEMGAAGDPCEFINVCDPGTFCGDPAAFPGCDPQAAGCCIPFCALGDPQCPPGTECQPWYDPQDTPAGYEDLGACVVPG